MAECYTKNHSGYKNSCEKYRNINGVRYQQWTYEKDKFKEEKQKAKELGLKCRVIGGELYREVKETTGA